MTWWAYLIIFNDHLGTRDDVQGLLDKISEIGYWYSCMPNCVFFTSTLPADDISEKIFEEFGKGNKKRFLITEIHPDRQGWLPRKAWHIFRNPDNPELKE